MDSNNILLFSGDLDEFIGLISEQEKPMISIATLNEEYLQGIIEDCKRILKKSNERDREDRV
jgi:hypothetical protein